MFTGSRLRTLNARLVTSLALATLAVAAVATDARADDVDKALAERLAKEKEDRKACKKQICETGQKHVADGPDIACTVVKTWLPDELKNGVLKGTLDWPFGAAQCKADIKMSRKMLAEALSPGEHEAKLEKHALTCTLDHKDGKSAPYSITFSVAPVVKFKDGKTVKVILNWSDVQGSAVAQGAVWSVATLDNNLGVLEGAAVRSIDDFFGPHCEEVK